MLFLLRVFEKSKESDDCVRSFLVKILLQSLSNIITTFIARNETDQNNQIENIVFFELITSHRLFFPS